MKSSMTMVLFSVVAALAAVGCAAGTDDTTSSLTSAINSAAAGDTPGVTETGATDGGRPRGHRKPPEEAFTACDAKAAGDACSVTHEDHTITGTCVAAPEGAEDTRLHCRPDQPPPGGHGGPRGHGEGPRGGDCPAKTGGASGEPDEAAEEEAASAS